MPEPYQVSSLQRCPHFLIPRRCPNTRIFDAAGFVVRAAHVKWQAMLVDENVAEDRVHGFAGVCHRVFEIELLGHGFLAAFVERFNPALGVVQRFVDVGFAFHGFASAGHDVGGF
jgi:hypothetical protein